MEQRTNASRDLFPGAPEMMILESLRRQPAHGYALVQHIQQRSNNLLPAQHDRKYIVLITGTNALNNAPTLFVLVQN